MRDKGRTQPLAAALLLLFCGLLSSAEAKYIFTKEPLLRKSLAVGEQDLFGYAAAFHLVDDSGGPSDFTKAIENTKIIVGAPNGTFPGGANVTRLEGDEGGPLDNTGLVYVCPISPPGKCEALTGNGTRNDIRMFDYQDNSIGTDAFDKNLMVQNEQKSGQFMGATIVSTGNHIMACAPRWISLHIDDFIHGPVDKTRAHGRCFIAGRNMENFKLLRPCDMDNSQSLVGQSYCMAGTAASLQERESESEVSVFLGGPPYDESSGAVFSINLTKADVAGTSSLDLDSSDFTFLPVKNTMQQFWYTGTAVTVGRIFSTDRKDLIYSLPKKNIYKGSVEVYSHVNEAIEATVLGLQMGEYFGWAVATADLNGDGFDEIIVGAPLFSTPDSIEKGRIFIYKNNGTLDTYNPIIIPGNGAKGRYGSAIVNLGDINSDGFEDIAVGAPFEVHEGGAEGTVYVYLGSGETVINTTPEDTITARNISETLGLEGSGVLKSFGYSLSSGVDVDANWNNDLVVGDYIQQSIIVFRTNSIANVSLSLSTNATDPFEHREANCPTSMGNFACVELVITASFSGRGLDGRSLETKMQVRENPVSTGRRLFFLDSDGNETNVYEEFLNFATTDTPINKSVIVYVRGVEETDRFQPLSLVVALFEKKRNVPKEYNVTGLQEVFDLRDYPLLNVLPQNNTELTLGLTQCNIPDMCIPQLQLSLNTIRYLDSKKDPTDFKEIIADGVSFVEVVLDYRTLTEDAINSRLILTLPSLLLGAPQSIRDTANISSLATSQCQQNADDQTYTCFVDPVFSYTARPQVAIIIAVVPGLTGDEDCLDNCEANFTLITEDSNIANDSQNTLLFNFSVSALANVEISELTVNPNSAQYEDTDELKPVITTKLTLTNSGPSTIPTSQVVIQLPGQTEATGDFYYLYPDRTSIPSSVMCSELNPDNLILNVQGNQKRRKRGTLERVWEGLTRSEEDEEEEEGKSLQKRQDNSRMVDCSITPEACTSVVCEISGFTRTSLSIVVLSYVDNRFFRTQTGNFEFYMHAVFNITTDFVNGPSSSKKSNKLLVTEPQKPSKSEVPGWVIAVTVISAIITVIILVGIIILLYMFGFFKRKNTEEHFKKKVERSQSMRVAGSGAAAGPVKKTPEEPESLDSKPDEPDQAAEEQGETEAVELGDKQPEVEAELPEEENLLGKASSETQL